jgi:ATP-binding cassette subfamily F protein uup
VLVTHDRFMLDRVSTVVLGLDGLGTAERFADYSQWDAWQRSRRSETVAQAAKINRGSSGTAQAIGPVAKKKLSYSESREYENMESIIAEAEKDLQKKHAALENPEITGERASLQKACSELDEVQKRIDTLYARWAELEQKQS